MEKLLALGENNLSLCKTVPYIEEHLALLDPHSNESSVIVTTQSSLTHFQALPLEWYGRNLPEGHDFDETDYRINPKFPTILAPHIYRIKI